jgi:hypothetical protein
METPYKEAFPAGSRVRIVSRPALDAFAQSWKFHHRLQPEQMDCAGTTSTVRNVGFYRGGIAGMSLRTFRASGMNHVWNLHHSRFCSLEPQAVLRVSPGPAGGFSLLDLWKSLQSAKPIEPIRG